MQSSSLALFDKVSPVHVLGPGRRAVIWLQGCSLFCRGCLVPESWPVDGGEVVAVGELTDWVLAQNDIEGITLSGGEPMLQALALVDLIDGIRARKDLGVVCYTGLVWEDLQATATDGPQQALLRRIDLLIDGPYVESRHADLLWRASTNQRLLPLTPRYRYLWDDLLPKGDCSAGIQPYLGDADHFQVMGVPPLPGFRRMFEVGMAEWGVTIKKS
ncbi:MAG: radical SAM protein [Magnetococcales bacterium]|nr:radical SAM protein [Magnetococcales bacterium]MBF0323298.1 radical SAM protein [Magnetococcales bacterium]